MTPASCLYRGPVVHVRLRPKMHRLRYRVFSLLIDVDRVGELAASHWPLSYNRFNLVSIYDRDHGAFDGASLAGFARQTFRAAGLEQACERIFLLSYPRVLGYGFNPISVFYGYDDSGRLQGAIYEVNNTFGERRSYVVGLEARAADTGHVHAHGCRKDLYVSPFTDMDARYTFRLGEPGERVALGVALHDREGALLNAYFAGEAVPLSARTLLWELAVLPLMTLKVTAAIHFEALRLWLKGVPLTVRPPAPRYGVTQVARGRSS